MTASTHQADPVVFESTEPERTEAHLNAIYGNGVQIRRDADQHAFRTTRQGFGQLQFVTMENAATLEYQTGPLNALSIMRIDRGTRDRVDAGEVFGPGDVCLHGEADQPLRARLTSAHYSTVVVPTQALADAGHLRPDDTMPPLRFESLRPTDPTAMRRWLHAVAYVTDNLRTFPDTVNEPLLCSAATRLLAATALSTFPNNWVTGPHRQDRQDATPATLARAVAFIDTNADRDITIADIARAAYVTVRAIQLAFRRHMNTTPMAYLRHVRLEGAHKQLSALSPNDGATVTEIAARWGFAEPSHFGALYRRAYGQPPSQTLRS
jgi:AraC-like DNA-binding protein